MNLPLRQGPVLNSKYFFQLTPSLLQNFQASLCTLLLTGQRMWLITLGFAIFEEAEGSDASSVPPQEQPQPRFEHCIFSLLSSISPSQPNPFPL